ncbi:hypothetical protein CYMTET_52724 [Cymbomonas tetramitiformis]|uniref:Methyltransferase n=1 Tax=Cymbomonas tetramitiformis TaxID=36881 RepID=A0AAE0EQS2_9CHLO|nr:hypothetical protein CYMTET_52724 [Cymbomonas tetramitiformis]
MTYVQNHHQTLMQDVHGEPDLETKLLVWMLIQSSNKFYTARFDEVTKSMMKAKRWKRVDSKEGRAMDKSVNKPSQDTMHTYKTLVDCAATRMILCYIHSLPGDYIEIGNARRFGATFTIPKLYGPAYTEAPVYDPAWFLQTLGITHTKRGFEENCLHLLWAIQAAAGSHINMAPAVLAASRMMEAKEMPDINNEIAAFSAKAVWEWLELRVKASRRGEGMPDALIQTEIFDHDWEPKSAVIEFMELKIEHKELHAAEGVQQPVDFNKCHRALQAKLLTGLLDFGIKEVPLPPKEYLKKEDGQNIRSVQKPIRLYRELMRLYSNMDACVMEFPCGTAPASMAGYMEQRHVLSIDMDAEVLKIARARYSEVLAGDIALIEKQKANVGDDHVMELVEVAACLGMETVQPDTGMEADQPEGCFEMPDDLAAALLEHPDPVHSV